MARHTKIGIRTVGKGLLSTGPPRGGHPNDDHEQNHSVALDIARQMDVERKSKGRRAPHIDQLLARAVEFNALRADGAGPNPNRWTLLKREAESGGLDDYR
jgi:hypothetical protein